jgi:serine/threonine-protein kinase RCK2
MVHQAQQQPAGDAYSVADAGAQNRGAQVGNAAAHAAGQNQKITGGNKQKVTTDELARIVAEEKVSKGKLPRYPGLERWRLIEKMGDGAFSNVYRAIDTEGTAGEVAIKVVRKFEMNQNQVRQGKQAHNFPWTSSF